MSARDAAMRSQLSSPISLRAIAWRAASCWSRRQQSAGPSIWMEALPLAKTFNSICAQNTSSSLRGLLRQRRATPFHPCGRLQQAAVSLLCLCMCRAPPALATVSKYAFIVQRIANDAAERYNCIARAHVEYQVHTQAASKSSGGTRGHSRARSAGSQVSRKAPSTQ